MAKADTERKEQRNAARPILALLDAAAARQPQTASTTDRGHGAKAPGEAVPSEIGVFLVGVDLWDEARGGTKTTKRNRILTPCGTYFRNTKGGRKDAAIWALTNARHKNDPEKYGLLTLTAAW